MEMRRDLVLDVMKEKLLNSLNEVENAINEFSDMVNALDLSKNKILEFSIKSSNLEEIKLAYWQRLAKPYCCVLTDYILFETEVKNPYDTDVVYHIIYSLRLYDNKEEIVNGDEAAKKAIAINQKLCEKFKVDNSKKHKLIIFNINVSKDSMLIYWENLNEILQNTSSGNVWYFKKIEDTINKVVNMCNIKLANAIIEGAKKSIEFFENIKRELIKQQEKELKENEKIVKELLTEKVLELDKIQKRTFKMTMQK